MPARIIFSDGITEDVITALGRFSNLLVCGQIGELSIQGSRMSHLPRSGACSMRATCSTAVFAGRAIAFASTSN